MSPRTRPDAETLRRTLRSMAVLGSVLGPVLVLGAAAAWSCVHALALLEAQPGAFVPPIPPPLRAAMRFAVESGVITAPLGAGILAASLAALKEPKKGRPFLALAAWTSIAAMLALGALWIRATAIAGLDQGFGVAGAAIHGAQAVILVPAALFLGSARLKAALA